MGIKSTILKRFKIGKKALEKVSPKTCVSQDTSPAGKTRKRSIKSLFYARIKKRNDSVCKESFAEVKLADTSVSCESLLQDRDNYVVRNSLHVELESSNLKKESTESQQYNLLPYNGNDQTIRNANDKTNISYVHEYQNEPSDLTCNQSVSDKEVTAGALEALQQEVIIRQNQVRCQLQLHREKSSSMKQLYLKADAKCGELQILLDKERYRRRNDLRKADEKYEELRAKFSKKVHSYRRSDSPTAMGEERARIKMKHRHTIRLISKTMREKVEELESVIKAKMQNEYRKDLQYQLAQQKDQLLKDHPKNSQEIHFLVASLTTYHQKELEEMRLQYQEALNNKQKEHDIQLREIRELLVINTALVEKTREDMTIEMDSAVLKAVRKIKRDHREEIQILKDEHSQVIKQLSRKIPVVQQTQSPHVMMQEIEGSNHIVKHPIESILSDDNCRQQLMVEFDAEFNICDKASIRDKKVSRDTVDEQFIKGLYWSTKEGTLLCRNIENEQHNSDEELRRRILHCDSVESDITQNYSAFVNYELGNIQELAPSGYDINASLENQYIPLQEMEAMIEDQRKLYECTIQELKDQHYLEMKHLERSSEVTIIEAQSQASEFLRQGFQSLKEMKLAREQRIENEVKDALLRKEMDLSNTIEKQRLELLDMKNRFEMQEKNWERINQELRDHHHCELQDLHHIMDTAIIAAQKQASDFLEKGWRERKFCNVCCKTAIESSGAKPETNISHILKS
jgi:hypothetical protein